MVRQENEPPADLNRGLATEYTIPVKMMVKMAMLCKKHKENAGKEAGTHQKESIAMKDGIN